MLATTASERGVDLALKDRLQRLVPREYAERLLATRGQVGMQRRAVTILFSDVKGSTTMAEDLDPEDWLEVMDGAFDVLIEPIYRYEGTLARLMGDAVLAFFGAPIAHEDDPERACRAALEIVQGAQGYAARLEAERGISGFDVRVGIHTGLVVVGEVGSDLRVEYTAMGDAVNLAARMESAAEPGTVLITQATHELIAPLFETEALGPVEFRGKKEPVAVYRVLAPKVAPTKLRGMGGLESPLVGREAEFARLAEVVACLQAGVGGIVTVVGEAGIGKSRLVAELQKQRPPGVQWIEGRCLSYGTSTAYHLWLDVLRGVVGMSAEDQPLADRDTLRQQVRNLCPDHYDEVYPYLARLMSLPLEDEVEADLSDLEGRDLKARTFRAAATLVECATQQGPLVLITEDLQWADPTSVELLKHLLALTDRAALLFICVFRPRRECGCWLVREVAARDYPHRHSDVWLQPLSSGDSELLVCKLLQTDGISTAFREKVLSVSEGNPFYVEEILRGLIDQGLAIPDGTSGRWQLTEDVAGVDLPTTLHGLLQARIDRLQEDTKQVLQIAAVIGRIFLYRVLASIVAAAFDSEGHRLDEHLLTVQREQMIRERARIPELEYIFKHELTREAAYNGLLKRQRREYHRQVAEALELLFPERAEEHVGLLAHHWERAGVPDKAVSYLVRAAEQAGRSYACAEAIEHLDLALELAERAPLADTILADIHQRRGQAYASIGNMGAARQNLTWVLAWARSTGNRIKVAETLLELIQPLLTGHELDQAFTCAQEAYTIAASLGDNRLIARSTGAIGAALCVRGDLRQARDYLQTGLKAASAFETQDFSSDVLGYYLMERYWRGDFAEVLSRVDAAVALSEETQRPHVLQVLYMFSALSWCSLGAYQKALDMLAKADELATKAGMTNAPAELLNCMGWVHQEIYDLQTSARLNGECSRLAHELGETESEANALVNLGVDHLWLGDQARAEECFVRAWDLLEKQFGGFRWRWKTRLLAAWGELCLVQGQPQQALDYAEQCLALAEQTSARKNLVKGWKLKGEALAALGRSQEAQACLQEAVKMAAELGNPPLLWKSRHALADTLRRQGRAAEAQEQSAQAAAVVQETAAGLTDRHLRETFLAAGPICAILKTADHPKE
jgi:class 3 adenylate cyclase/tetratricopeptide (TPR) repeat protein